jgi:hypothetical protein
VICGRYATRFPLRANPPSGPFPVLHDRMPVSWRRPGRSEIPCCPLSAIYQRPRSSAEMCSQCCNRFGVRSRKPHRASEVASSASSISARRRGCGQKGARYAGALARQLGALRKAASVRHFDRAQMVNRHNRTISHRCMARVLPDCFFVQISARRRMIRAKARRAANSVCG